MSRLQQEGRVSCSYRNRVYNYNGKVRPYIINAALNLQRLLHRECQRLNRNALFWIDLYREQEIIGK